MDTLESTKRFFLEVNHKAIKLNLDFLHLWEFGADPIKSFDVLKKWVVNFHFKNIINEVNLSVFNPTNIYSPNGSRKGIVPLNEGKINYIKIIKYLIENKFDKPISLEWFGKDPFNYLELEIKWLKEIEVLPCLETNINN